MPDEPRFVVSPPLRCFCATPKGSSPVCGVRAEVMRPGPGDVPVGYFCARHAQPGDSAIPDVCLFRRVNVTLEVLLAGASLDATPAQIEAVSRLERHLRGAGGLINLHAVRSTLGRGSPPRPSEEWGRG